MPPFNIVGTGPVTETIDNNGISINLVETGVVSNGNTHHFINNINELIVDKYGLIQSVTTGSVDHLNTELLLSIQCIIDDSKLSQTIPYFFSLSSEHRRSCNENHSCARNTTITFIVRFSALTLSSTLEIRHSNRQ